MHQWFPIFTIPICCWRRSQPLNPQLRKPLSWPFNQLCRHRHWFHGRGAFAAGETNKSWLCAPMISILDAYNLLLTSKSIPKVHPACLHQWCSIWTLTICWWHQSQSKKFNLKKRVAAVPREASSIVVFVRRHPWFSNQGVPGVGTDWLPGFISQYYVNI